MPPCNESRFDRRRLAVFALVLVIFLSRTPALMWPILDVDEADFAVQTAVWINGGIPYVDFVEKKPPLIHAAYAAAFLVGGTWNMAAVHMLFALMAVATGLLLMKAAALAGGRRTALPALALFAAYQAGYDANDFLMAGTEIPMNLASAAAAYFALTAFAGENRRGRFFASGFCTAFAVLAKPVAAAFLPAILAGDLKARIGEKRLGAIAGDAASFAAGCLVPISVVAALLLNAGALDDAVRWVWTENLAYAGASVPLSARLAHGATRIGVYIFFSWPLWILAVGRVASVTKSRSCTAADLLCAVWLSTSFWTASLGWRFFPHYFMQFIPPLVILAAMGWSFWLKPLLDGSRRLTAAAFAVGIALPLIAFTAYQFHHVRLIERASLAEQEIAGEISNNSGSDDRIFVWGHSSDVYFFSRRLPAARFAYCSFLTNAAEGFEEANVLGRGSDDAWLMLMDDLSRQPPALFVDMSGTGIRGYAAYPAEAYPELRDFLNKGYEQRASIHGARIFSRNRP